MFSSALPSTRPARLALLALGLAACDSPTDVLPAPPPPAHAISDAAHGGGNPHFFFLPPMVPAPASYHGTFDATRQPEVVVCVWTGSACSGGDVARFTDEVKVSLADEHYGVNWQTEGLSAGVQYRIRVLVEGTELGYADVIVGENGAALRNVNTAEFIPLLDGRTLPIHFRIEAGAVVPSGFASVSGGQAHACGLTLDGRAYCWGYGTGYQLGSGASESSSVPVEVSTVLRFTQVTVGGVHACGLTADGAAYCWGGNDKGMLGDRTTDSRPLPTAVAGGHVFRQLSAGAFHTCGITTANQAYCWGYNASGELGTVGLGYGQADAMLEPDLVQGGIAFADISVAASATCGVSTSGQAYCWGFNEYGRLGTGSDAQLMQPTPVLQPAGTSFTSIALGGLTACALTASGAAWCWGSNELGSAGIGTHFTMELVPVPVVGGLAFTHLSAGAGHVCGVTAGAQAYCWGFNGYGQVGDGSAPANYGPPAPVAVAGGESYVQVEAGEEFTCAVTTNRALRCWGRNDWGQLGDGSTANANAPVAVVNPL